MGQNIKTVLAKTYLRLLYMSFFSMIVIFILCSIPSNHNTSKLKTYTIEGCQYLGDLTTDHLELTHKINCTNHKRYNPTYDMFFY